jgi:hypothetical protein
MAGDRAKNFAELVAAYEAYEALFRVNHGALQARGSPFLELIKSDDERRQLAVQFAIGEVFSAR